MSELAPEPLVPPLALAALIACVAGAAALADCALLAVLIKRSRTGLFSIIIQLAIADIILLGTAIGPELWTLNSRNWGFGNRACAAYQGLNVFTSALSTYLVVAIALHTITTIRIEEKTMDKRTKRKDSTEDEEIRSSQHSLVANSDTSTPPRTMNVDYRAAVDAAVPVTLPTVFVWILAASLSIPEFVLSTTINLRKNSSMCILDFTHQFNIQSLLTVFSLFLPLFIMSTASALIIVKLNSKSQKRQLPTADGCGSQATLKLSLWLICVHVILCTPRTVVKAYRVYSALDEDESTLNAPAHTDTTAFISLALSSAYLLATLIRPLLCIIVLPRFRYFFSLHAKITDSV